MVATEPGEIEQLSAADIAAGLALSDEAGWNQTAEDWRLFITEGLVWGQRSHDGTLITTAALLPMGGAAAWLSLVLVTKAWRRRGLASGLMRHAINAASRSGVVPWLDATPAGATVYRPLGFVTLSTFTRLRRKAETPSSPRPARDPVNSSSAIDALLALDRKALGLERGGVVRKLAERSGSIVYGDAAAVCLVRAGRKARQIGPVCATTAEGAIGVLDAVLAHDIAELVIDVNDRDPSIRAHLIARGFEIERPYERMRLGAAPLPGADDMLFAIVGPEYG